MNIHHWTNQRIALCHLIDHARDEVRNAITWRTIIRAYHRLSDRYTWLQEHDAIEL